MIIVSQSSAWLLDHFTIYLTVAILVMISSTFRRQLFAVAQDLGHRKHIFFIRFLLLNFNQKGISLPNCSELKS